MIKYVRLKNFKSFGDTSFDFTNSNKTPKKLIGIYGENGSGKSNFIQSISFLMHSLITLSFQNNINKMLDEKQVALNEKDIKQYIINSRESLSDEINECKTIGTTNDMEMLFVFDVEGKEAYYKMIFDNESIISESLRYPLEKNMTTVFLIEKDNIKFNNNLFKDSKYQNEIKEDILKYFGKHTFLSIIVNQTQKYNQSYVIERIAPAFKTFIDSLFDICLLHKSVNQDEGLRPDQNEILTNLFQGRYIYSEKILNIINNCEKALNNFLVPLYSDIKEVVYEKTKKGNEILYQLYINKLIDGEVRHVPFVLESTGTIKLLTIFPLIYDVMVGKTVLIDEIDTGIHDILMETIIVTIQKQAKGQLIFTTHNTLLLKSLNPEYAYSITSDINGCKQVHCFKDFERIQSRNNMADRYLSGAYGGIPFTGYFDLMGLVTEVENSSNEKNKC